jgi:hypothetical protein
MYMSVLPVTPFFVRTEIPIGDSSTRPSRDTATKVSAQGLQKTIIIIIIIIIISIYLLATYYKLKRAAASVLKKVPPR